MVADVEGVWVTCFYNLIAPSGPAWAGHFTYHSHLMIDYCLSRPNGWWGGPGDSQFMMEAHLTWSPDSPGLSMEFLEDRRLFLKKEKLRSEEGADSLQNLRVLRGGGSRIGACQGLYPTSRFVRDTGSISGHAGGAQMLVRQAGGLRSPSCPGRRSRGTSHTHTGHRLPLHSYLIFF